MKFTEKDYRESEIVADIIQEIDNSSMQELSKMFDEIWVYQPIMISIYWSYRDVLSDEELDELRKDLIIIWKFFSNKSNSKKIKITESHLKKFDKRNTDFFNYLSGEDENEMKEITEVALEAMDSKAILAALIYRFSGKSIFKKMDQDKKNKLVLELKTLIECFEDINK